MSNSNAIDIPKIEKLFEKITKDIKKYQNEDAYTEPEKYMKHTQKTIELYELTLQEITGSLDLMGLVPFSTYSPTIQNLFKGMQNLVKAVLHFGLHHFNLRDVAVIKPKQRGEDTTKSAFQFGSAAFSLVDHDVKELITESDISNQTCPPINLAFDDTKSIAGNNNFSSAYANQMSPKTTSNLVSLPVDSKAWKIQGSPSRSVSPTELRNSHDSASRSPKAGGGYNNGSSPMNIQGSYYADARGDRNAGAKMPSQDEDERELRKYMEEHEEIKKEIDEVLKGRDIVESIMPTKKVEVGLQEVLRDLNSTKKKVDLIAVENVEDSDEDSDNYNESEFEKMGDRIKKAFDSVKGKAVKNMEDYLKSKNTEKALKEADADKKNKLKLKKKVKPPVKIESTMKDCSTMTEEVVHEEESVKTTNKGGKGKTGVKKSEATDLRAKVAEIQLELTDKENKFNKVVDELAKCTKDRLGLENTVLELEIEINSLRRSLTKKTTKAKKTSVIEQGMNTSPLIFERQQSDSESSKSEEKANSPKNLPSSNQKPSLSSSDRSEEIQEFKEHIKASPIRVNGGKATKVVSNEPLGRQSKLRLLREFNDEVIEPETAEMSKEFERYTQKSQMHGSLSKITDQKQDSMTPLHGSMIVNITGDVKNIKDVDSDFNLASASLTMLESSQLDRNLAAEVLTSQNTSNVGSQLFVNQKLEVRKSIEKNYNKLYRYTPISEDKSKDEYTSADGFGPFRQKAEDESQDVSRDGKARGPKLREISVKSSSKLDNILKSPSKFLLEKSISSSKFRLEVGEKSPDSSSRPASTKAAEKFKLILEPIIKPNGEKTDSMASKGHYFIRGRMNPGESVLNKSVGASKRKMEFEVREVIRQKALQKHSLDGANSDDEEMRQQRQRQQQEEEQLQFYRQQDRRSTHQDLHSTSSPYYLKTVSKKNLYCLPYGQYQTSKNEKVHLYASMSSLQPNGSDDGRDDSIKLNEMNKMPQSSMQKLTQGSIHDIDSDSILDKRGSVQSHTIAYTRLRPTIEDCIRLELIKDHNSPASSKEEAQVRVMYRGLLNKAKQDPKVTTYIKKLVLENDSTVVFGDHPVLEYEIFESFITTFHQLHSACGENCAHIVNFYSKIGYHAVWNNRVPLNVKRAVVVNGNMDLNRGSSKLPNIRKKKELLKNN